MLNYIDVFAEIIKDNDFNISSYITEFHIYVCLTREKEELLEDKDLLSEIMNLIYSSYLQTNENNGMSIDRFVKFVLDHYDYIVQEDMKGNDIVEFYNNSETDRCINENF